MSQPVVIEATKTEKHKLCRKCNRALPYGAYNKRGGVTIKVCRVCSDGTDIRIQYVDTLGGRRSERDRRIDAAAKGLLDFVFGAARVRA